MEPQTVTIFIALVDKKKKQRIQFDAMLTYADAKNMPTGKHGVIQDLRLLLSKWDSLEGVVNVDVIPNVKLFQDGK